MLQDDKWADDFDDHYRALPQSPDGKLDVSSTAWNARLNELDEAIKQKKYNLYHHRWLETMSKAVDMRRVMNLIKTKQAPVAA